MEKFIILVLSTILVVSSINYTFANSIYVQSSETEYKFISNFGNSDEYMDACQTVQYHSAKLICFSSHNSLIKSHVVIDHLL